VARPITPTKIYRAAVGALRLSGQVAFQKSQQRVPVRTGRLKASGRYRTVPGGFTISYRTPYAARIEFGIRPGRTINVRRHRYRVPPGTVVTSGGKKRTIKAGYRYRGPYSYVTKGQAGRYYLTSSLLEELSQFSERFLRNLADLGLRPKRGR
jgi:hypothetical protein